MTRRPGAQAAARHLTRVICGEGGRTVMGRLAVSRRPEAQVTGHLGRVDRSEDGRIVVRTSGCVAPARSPGYCSSFHPHSAAARAAESRWGRLAVSLRPGAQVPARHLTGADRSRGGSIVMGTSGCVAPARPGAQVTLLIISSARTAVRTAAS